MYQLENEIKHDLANHYESRGTISEKEILTGVMQQSEKNIIRKCSVV